MGSLTLFAQGNITLSQTVSYLIWYFLYLKQIKKCPTLFIEYIRFEEIHQSFFPINVSLN